MPYTVMFYPTNADKSGSLACRWCWHEVVTWTMETCQPGLRSLQRREVLLVLLCSCECSECQLKFRFIKA